MVVYLDDIVLYGHSVEDVWANTIEVIRQLTTAGFMLNINKCTFLTKEIDVVGYQVSKGLYYSKQKTISKLLKAKLPSNFSEL